MTGPQAFPDATKPPMDSDDDDDDDDDVVDTGDDLPDDIPNDDLTATEPPVTGPIVDTDVDAPVLGTPPLDEEIGG